MRELTVDNCYLVNGIVIRDDNNFTISILKDERDKVVVVVQEHGNYWDKGRIRRFVLGRKTIEKLPDIDKVLARKFKMRKEVCGE